MGGMPPPCGIGMFDSGDIEKLPGFIVIMSLLRRISPWRFWGTFRRIGPEVLDRVFGTSLTTAKVLVPLGPRMTTLSG